MTKSSVSAKIFVTPNMIDFKNVWKKFAGLADNMAVLGTILVVLIIFTILIVCFRRMDKIDEEKWKVKELLDNKEKYKYIYLVTVITGLRKDSGTQSKVGFSVTGEKHETGERLLCDGVTKGFDRGSMINFLMRTSKCLGPVQYMHIWHDCSGRDGEASWFLDKVVLLDVLTDETFVFLCNNWLAVEEGDGKIERVLPAAGTENVTEFKNRFSDLMRTNLTDGHLWYSLWSRPSRSNFTRVQRASSCLSLLFLTMVSNAMFFETEQGNSWSIKVGPFRFSWHQLYTSLISLLIVLPVNIIIVTLFRRSKRSISRDETDESSISTIFANFFKTGKIETGKDTVKNFNNSNFNDIMWVYKRDNNQKFDDKTSNVKKSCCTFFRTELPSYGVRIAWTLVLLACSVSGFFVILYSVDWGKAKSERWLTAFFLSFLQSLFLIDPVKVVVIAFAITLFTKKPRADHYMVTDDEYFITSPKVPVHDEEQTLPPRKLSAIEKQKCRAKRFQQKICHAFFKEFLFYSTYIIMICIVCYAIQDPNSYPMAENIQRLCTKPPKTEGLQFEKIQSTRAVFRWMNNVFLPRQFAQMSYNKKPLSWRRRRYMTDGVSYRIGPARIRQLRVEPEPCTKGIIGQYCRPSYSMTKESTRTFGIGKNTSATKPFLTKTAWKFSPMLDIHGVPQWGKISVYGGGGYISDLEINLPVSKAIIQELNQNRWIDKQTRALFIEFTVFNPFVNLFCWTNIVFEYLPEGGIIPSITTKVFKLYFEDSFTGGVMVVAFFVFMTLSVALAIASGINIYKYGKLHFRTFTAWIECALIMFSFAVIVLYFSTYMIAKKTIEKFKINERKYIQFHPVVTTYELLKYMFGFLVFIATVRLLLMLRIMKNVRIFGMTLRSTVKPFAFFFLQFSFIYMAYSHLAHLIFCRTICGYMSMPKTFLSLIAFAIKQHNLDVMLDTKPFLGTVFYISYVLVVSLSVTNIFIATIVHYHHQVRIYMEKDRNYLRRAVRDEIRVTIRNKWTKFKFKIKEFYTRMKMAMPF